MQGPHDAFAVWLLNCVLGLVPHWENRRLGWPEFSIPDLKEDIAGTQACRMRGSAESPGELSAKVRERRPFATPLRVNRRRLGTDIPQRLKPLFLLCRFGFGMAEAMP